MRWSGPRRWRRLSDRHGPSLRLLAASPEVELDAEDRAIADAPGVYVAAVGGDFELRVSRPNYGQRLRIVQVDAGTGAVVRTLPSRLRPAGVACVASRE